MDVLEVREPVEQVRLADVVGVAVDLGADALAGQGFELGDVVVVSRDALFLGVADDRLPDRVLAASLRGGRARRTSSLSATSSPITSVTERSPVVSVPVLSTARTSLSPTASRCLPP